MARALAHIHLHFVHSPMYPVQTIGSGNAPLGADAGPVAGVCVARRFCRHRGSCTQWGSPNRLMQYKAARSSLLTHTLQRGDNIPRPGGGKSDPRQPGGDAR